MKKEAEKKTKASTADPGILLSMARKKILSSPLYTLIDCPESVGELIPSTERICFAGKGEAEQFIDFFTPAIAKMGSGKVYWNRDSGLWLANFDLEASQSEMVVGVRMKGDSNYLSVDPKFDEFDMLINCTLFIK